MSARVAEGIAGVLAAAGVPVFGVPASETMGIVVAADRRGVPVYHARHEQAAVGMADGYGRFSGRPGVAVVGRGPGFTNGLNALVTAAKARSPVVVVTGELPTPFRGGRAGAHVFASKNVDQGGIAELAGCDVVDLATPDEACPGLARALALAAAGRSVVVLAPTDVLSAELPGPTPDLEWPPAPAPVDPDRAAVAAVADLLGEEWACRRPLVLAGRGATSPEARGALAELGERIGAVMVTTLCAKDLFAGDPADGGVLGTLSDPATSALAVRSDLVLAFGASLNPFTTYGGDLLGKARLVHVDRDPAALGRHVEPELAVRGDAAATARLLVEALRRRDHKVEGYRRPTVLADLAAARGAALPAAAGGDGRGVLRALDAALPTDRAVVVDAGAHMPLAASCLRVPHPRRFLTTAVDYTSVGSAFGIAAGAAVADPGVTTVLVIGDGGLAMALPDLQTLARYRLPVVVVVLNDAAFGQEVQLLQLAGLPDDIARYPSLAFAELARAVGVDARTLRSPEDVGPVADLLARRDGPVLLDCKVTTGTLGEHSALVSRLGR